jgi:(E)-4-hydroxy-3-methyl-but-2-enyl pyrophosphate reductase
MNIINTASVALPQPNQFGFCEGVEAADQLMNRTVSQARLLGIDVVYGYNDIVHNDTVREYHVGRGVVFVHNSASIPDGSLVVESAHGSSPQVTHDIESRDGYVVDGMCTLVGHTHKAVKAARDNGEKLLYLYDGKLEHDEVKGTVGHMDLYIDEKHNLRDDKPIDRAMMKLPDSNFEDIVEAQFGEILRYQDPRYRVIGQTTLIASKVHAYIGAIGEALHAHQPSTTIARLKSLRQVCRAVEERQEGVENAVSVSLGRKTPEVTVVVTSPESTNGNSYAAQASEIGPADMLVITVANADELTKREAELEGRRVFVTASASTPDDDIRGVVERLGGNISLVPKIRDAFNIPNTTDNDLYERIKKWRDGEHGK